MTRKTVALSLGVIAASAVILTLFGRDHLRVGGDWKRTQRGVLWPVTMSG